MNTQFYGIKYPFSEESERLTFLDLNETKGEGIQSKVLHIIFTPKGQRLRKPEFGTNLMKFLFEPNDGGTWDRIKEEIRQQISLYLPEVTFNDIAIIRDEEDVHTVFVQVDYSFHSNGETIENKTLVRI